MKNALLPIFSFLIMLSACRQHKDTFDASGSFEADEVIVSAQSGGQLLSFPIHEGDSLQKGEQVGYVDSTTVALQKEQVLASIQTLSDKTVNVSPQVKLLQKQIAVQQAQLEHLEFEKARTERLLQDHAVPKKQLDDLNTQIDVLQKQVLVNHQQIAVQKNNTAAQNRGILSEGKPLRKQAAQLQEQLSKSKVINPITGVVLTKYAEEGEVTSPGKALYKIADLSELNLRAYVTGNQLSLIKLNQPVTIQVDHGADRVKNYSGKIIWISDKAEFTPKTIQTKEERANLVYAIKVNVKNDGYLKIGMYGEVKWNTDKGF